MAPESQIPIAPSSPHAHAAWPLAVMATFLILITALTAQFVRVTWFANQTPPAQTTAATVQRTALK